MAPFSILPAVFDVTNNILSLEARQIIWQREWIFINLFILTILLLFYNEIIYQHRISKHAFSIFNRHQAGTPYISIPKQLNHLNHYSFCHYVKCEPQTQFVPSVVRCKWLSTVCIQCEVQPWELINSIPGWRVCGRLKINILPWHNIIIFQSVPHFQHKFLP